jgi:hypothetical protein
MDENGAWRRFLGDVPVSPKLRPREVVSSFWGAVRAVNVAVGALQAA